MKVIIVFLLSVFLCGSAKAQHTISGTITEKVSGEYVIGASVMLLKDSVIKSENIITGSVTNKYGFFSVPGIESGEYFIAVSSLGYERYFKKIEIENDDISLNIGLINEDIRMKEVLVEAENERAMTDKISQVEISPQFIQKMPAFGGEVDVFRTMMLLPGVQQASELSSGLYIRGGSPDQNLVLLDDVIVYNPSHLAGFLSSFNSDALRDVKLIKGAFPAEYGGRLSSVIDLTMKEGTKEKLSGAGAISLISSKLTLEGPIDKNSSFMISGRRMYLDLIQALATSSDEEAPDYYFYDLNAKINYQIGENDRIFASGYFARDVFGFDDDYEDFEIFWGNKTGNLRWMHIFNPKLFSNFSLIYTDYEFQTRLSDKEYSENNYNSLSQIADLMLRGNIEYFVNNYHTIKAGAEITNHNFDVRASVNFSEADFDFVNTGNLNTLDMAFYAQDEWKIGNFINNFGFRAYYFQEGDYFDLEPRFSSVYKFRSDLSFKASFDIAHQYVHLVTRNDINLPTDLWFPSTKEIKPQKSMQGVIGIEKTFLNGEYLLSVESYYKYMTNLIEFKNDANFNFGIPSSDQFTFGEGRAYGMEIFFNRRIGNLTGWLGYTLAWTDRKFPELNDGKRFPPRYDRRHDISIAAIYNISDGWEIGAAWVFGTGQAFTVPDGSYYMTDATDFVSEQQYHYSDRNGFRLPPYHRLDLNLMRKFDWFGLPFEFSINIYNLYNRKNPFTWYIDEDWDRQTGDYEKNVTQVTLFPIIPTFGLRFEF